jgi:carboxymethylenebutenolidase
MRSVVFAIIAAVSVLGCKPAAPPETPPSPPSERTPPLQETVAYLGDDKNVHGYLCRPANENATYPAIVIVHDRLGLTAAVKDEAFRLAQEGYIALAVDLYRGRLVKSDDEAKRLQRELPKKRALGDLKSALDFLCDRPDVRKDSLGILGLGMGGVYALDAAERDSRLRAVALCYSPVPTEVEPLRSMKASVFYLRAAKDESVPHATFEKFCQAMANAGKRLERVREFGDCSYGFLDKAFWRIYGKPSESDVAEAWTLITRYFDKELS